MTIEERNQKNWEFIRNATESEQLNEGYASKQSRGFYKCRYCGISKMLNVNSFRKWGAICECVKKKQEEEAEGVWKENLKNWKYIDFATIKEKQDNGLRLATTYKKYSCSVCGEIRYFASGILKQNLKVCNNGCHGVGNGNVTVIRGINDMKTTHPHMVEYLVNEEDGLIYRAGSDKYLEMKCPICDYRKRLQPKLLMRRGFSCPNCKENTPYPEKFMNSLLKELRVGFHYQVTNLLLEWCGTKRYDFYIPSLNMIIETHGRQHYEDTAWGKLTNQQAIDKEKKDNAIKNGISHYIEIDCFKSNFEYIKESVVSSQLPQLINMECVDWDKVKIGSEKNTYLEVINFYNETKSQASVIAKRFKIDRSTVHRYLHRGARSGLCDYTPNQINYSEKPVVVVDGETKEVKYIFNSVTECANALNYGQHNISTLLKRDNPFVKSEKMGGTFGFYFLNSEKWESVKHLYKDPYAT